MTLQKLRIIGLVFFLMTMAQSLYATTGCLVGSSLYTSSNGTGSGLTYYDTSPSLNANGYCLRAGTITTPCQLRTWYWFFWSNGATGLKGDFGANNPPAYCSIDDYAGLLVLAVMGLGFVVLRKRLFF